MSGWMIALSLAAFVLLTLGTAVFVAAEFSLTALERSTVDANARTGGARDKMIQRAHRTPSIQLSGAQIGISITTLVTGYLSEPVIARLAGTCTGRRRPARTVGGGHCPDRVAGHRDLGVDGVRGTRRPIPRRRGTAADRPSGGRARRCCSRRCSHR